MTVTLVTMKTEWILIFLSFLFISILKGEQVVIVVNRTEIEANYDFVNCTVELKVEKKALKYGVDIDVDLRKPIDDFPVCILKFLLTKYSYKSYYL